MTTSSCGEASFSNPVPARGVRVHWEDLPPEIRAAFEERLGGRVIEAITQPTGFSPGLAARLRVEDGRRFFLKPCTRRRIQIRRASTGVRRVLSRRCPGTRRCRHFCGAATRRAGSLCFEDIDGRHPHEPWTEHDLALVVRTLNEMAVVLTPSPF